MAIYVRSRRRRPAHGAQAEWHITSSCNAALHSGRRLAVVFALACAGAEAVAGDHDSPARYPDLWKVILQQQALNNCASWRSVFCVQARLLGSRLHRQSKSRSSVPPAVARNSAHAHSLPSLRALSFLALLGYGRTVPLPRGAAVAGIHKRNLLEAQVIITT